MDVRDEQTRRLELAREHQLRERRARLAAFGALIGVAAVAVAIVFGSTGGSGSHATKVSRPQSSRSAAGRTAASLATGAPGAATVPILTYNVVNIAPPASAAPPELYVPTGEFSAQMDALKAAGWHPITLDQLQSYWTRGGSLGPGKPIVITFDGGYASHFANALPILKRLGWVGVENLQVSGLPPSEGGLTDSQVRALIAAGWELDAEGVSQADLTILSPSQLRNEVAGARATLRARYNVPANWFSYPSGRYNATVVAAVRAAGFVGATTLSPGWGSPQADRFRLPRLQVVGGTSASELLQLITGAEPNTSAPASVP